MTCACRAGCKGPYCLTLSEEEGGRVKGGRAQVGFTLWKERAAGAASSDQLDQLLPSGGKMRLTPAISCMSGIYLDVIHGHCGRTRRRHMLPQSWPRLTHPPLLVCTQGGPPSATRCLWRGPTRGRTDRHSRWCTTWTSTSTQRFASRRIPQSLWYPLTSVSSTRRPGPLAQVSAQRPVLACLRRFAMPTVLSFLFACSHHAGAAEWPEGGRPHLYHGQAHDRR